MELTNITKTIFQEKKEDKLKLTLNKLNESIDNYIAAVVQQAYFIIPKEKKNEQNKQTRREVEQVKSNLSDSNTTNWPVQVPSKKCDG